MLSGHSVQFRSQEQDPRELWLRRRREIPLPQSDQVIKQGTARESLGGWQQICYSFGSVIALPHHSIRFFLSEQLSYYHYLFCVGSPRVYDIYGLTNLHIQWDTTVEKDQENWAKIKLSKTSLDRWLVEFLAKYSKDQDKAVKFNESTTCSLDWLAGKWDHLLNVVCSLGWMILQEGEMNATYFRRWMLINDNNNKRVVHKTRAESYAVYT